MPRPIKHLRRSTANIYGSGRMKLYAFRAAPNFGDRLNFLVFPKLLGPIFDRDMNLVLLGIGTAIGARAPAGRHEIFLGAGAGYQRRRVSLANRTVYTVRGPETARLFGLPESQASIDPGVLVADLYPGDDTAQVPAGTLFMPHWQTEKASGPQWRAACAMAGIEYVSPLDDSKMVLARLRHGDLLITEALHGAVVAECYGRPWIPVVLGSNVLDFKWHDWCASIGTTYAPHTGLPALHDSQPIAPAAYFKRAAASLGLGKSGWRRIATRRTSHADTEIAAAELARIVTEAERRIHRRAPAAYARAVERLLAAIADFQRDWQAGRFAAWLKKPAA